MLKWTCSGFKGSGLLILPLTWIFILVKPLKTAAILGKNCLIQSSNPISSIWQILVIRPANPLCSNRQILISLELSNRVQGFSGWSKEDYKDLPTGGNRICRLDWTFFARNRGLLKRLLQNEKWKSEAISANHSL